MNNTTAALTRAIRMFGSEETGQDLIEYTLLLAFVALASAALFTSAGGSVSAIWGSASTNLANAAAGASS
jgi:Flp pilus assembly pilin Flp